MGKQSNRILVVVLLAAGLVLAAGTAAAQHHDGASQDRGQAAAAEEHASTTQHGEADREDGQDEAHGEARGGAPGQAHGEVHGQADDDAHGEEHGGGHGSMPHLVNAVGLVADAFTDEHGSPTATGRFLTEFVDPIFSLIVSGLIAFFFIRLRKNLDPRNPSRLQVLAEMILGGLYHLFEQIIGPTARRYTPYLGTLFIFIICNNLMGMIPLGHSATSSFQNTTFALGLATFFYVQGIAIKENGPLGYLHHMAGSPKTAMDWGFSVLLFPLHLLGELIKPISLSLRLFGNIFGEDTLIATMVILGYLLVRAIVGSDFVVGLPIQFPFYFLGLLGSTIQALVFALLSTVYIALMLPHGEHHEEAVGH